VRKLKRLKKRSAVFWMALFLGIILFFQFFSTELEKPAKELSYSELTQKIKTENIKEITIKGRQTTALDKQGQLFRIFTPYPEKLLDKLDGKNVDC